MSASPRTGQQAVTGIRPETSDPVTHAACPQCNPPDAPFVVTLCGIAQDPSEQVPPIGPFCRRCRRAAPSHSCFMP